VVAARVGGTGGWRGWAAECWSATRAGGWGECVRLWLRRTLEIANQVSVAPVSCAALAAAARAAATTRASSSCSRASTAARAATSSSRRRCNLAAARDAAAAAAVCWLALRCGSTNALSPCGARGACVQARGYSGDARAPHGSLHGYY